MKKLFFIFCLLIGYQGISQKVGINNTDPQTALDVNGGFRTRVYIESVNNSTNSILIPLNVSFAWIDGANSNYTINFSPGYMDGARLVFYNSNSFTGTTDSGIEIPSGKIAELIYLDGEFRLIGVVKGGLTLPYSATYNNATNPAFKIEVQNDKSAVELNNTLSSSTLPVLKAKSSGNKVVELENSGLGNSLRVNSTNSNNDTSAVYIASNAKKAPLAVEVIDVTTQDGRSHNAIDIKNGFIKVDQNANFRTAFIHYTNSSNIVGNATLLSYPDMKSSDLIFINYNWPYLGTNVSYYTWYDSVLQIWKISTLDNSTMTSGRVFFVLVIKTE